MEPNDDFYALIQTLDAGYRVGAIYPDTPEVRAKIAALKNAHGPLADDFDGGTKEG
jgi:hypothetical protein